MSPNPKVRGWGRAVLLLIFFLSASCAALAVTKKSKRGGDVDLTNIIRPQLLNAETDPTLRFPVMSMIGSTTYGWLDISSSTVRYTEMQPTRKSGRSFAVSRFAMSNLQFNRSFLMFKISKRWQQLIYVPQERWGLVHMAFNGLSKEADRDNPGTSSIYKTLLNFEGVLAIVKPPPAPAPVIARPVAPPPKPVAPPSAPAIVLLSPPGAGENQTLELSESTVTLRGVAMDSTGIPVVRINGSPVNMRPQTSQAAEFWSDPL
ncbi:MAG: hypothetical protein P4N24_16715, partial [Acidobacteriota bacterium]|nr:hypothetical protein [Acidobacteriota bacterium]